MSYRRPFANRNGISLFISNSSWSTVACSQQQGRSILCTTYTYFMFQASGFFSFWQGFLFIITFFLMKSCEILRMNWVTLSFIWPGNTTQRSWIFWGAVLYNFVESDFALRTTTPYQQVTHCKCSVFVMITRSAPLLLKVMIPH